MNKLQSMKYALAVLAVSLGFSSAKSEDYPFVMEHYPPHIEARLSAQSSSLHFARTDDYFISKLKLWDTSQPILVCFFGGTIELRKRIAQSASLWSQVGGHLPLNFGDINNPRLCSGGFNHIRVGFQYKGYWSTVGTDSITLLSQNEQSMNLALYDVNPPPEPKFTEIVLHEFGHAIGLQHEHQSHTSPCPSEFDWDEIYKYLSGPPNYWPKEQIDHNLRPRPDDGSTESGKWDRESIMLYSFPESFYKNGASAQCYTPGNVVLSEEDKNAVLLFYPPDVQKAKSIRKEALDEFNAKVDKLELTDVQKSVAKINAANLAGLSDGTQWVVTDTGQSSWSMTTVGGTTAHVPTSPWRQ